MRKAIFWFILITGCILAAVFSVSGRAEEGNLIALTQSTEDSINKGGDLALAETNLKKILEVNKGHAYAMRVLAKVYRMQFEKTNEKQYLELAQVEIEKSLKGMSRDAQCNAEAAMIYYLKNDKTNAMQTIDKALKLEPQSAYFKDIKRRIQNMP